MVRAGQCDPNDRGKDNGASGEQQRPRQSLRHDGHDWLAMANGSAKVETNSARKVMYILLGQRSVKPELGENGTTLSGIQTGCLFADEKLDGVAGKEVWQQEIDGDGKPCDEDIT